MTENTNLPQANQKYIFGFDEGVKIDSRECLCMGSRQVRGKLMFDFAYRNELNQGQSIIIYSIRREDFSLAGRDINQVTSSKESWMISDVNGRIRGDEESYKRLDERLKEAGI